jgi:hypothetical protein
MRFWEDQNEEIKTLIIYVQSDIITITLSISS